MAPNPITRHATSPLEEQMPRAPKACAHFACPNTQPCPDHQRKPWEGSTRRHELPPDWEHRRRRILQRDPLCTLATTCGGLALSTEVHHTNDPHDHSDQALAGVCKNCHRAETQRQAAEARRA